MKSIPRTRDEFERNMYILVDRIKKGQHFFPQGSGQVEELSKVRELPNKRINFLTVNETARLKANHIASMIDMDLSIFKKIKNEHQNTEE
ncbi:AVAST type 1 anti-phage system protein Avs1c [Flavobacterium sp. PL02]|uniref:AVAST type 1 anti-phage system protein Avs1c n=1 Tax=Flavobacterium sp. PL02 TaxID=3088354 RepID=UPI002B231022|nr:AVAST type 1 anti-phage system protein Avs1c [Flavobacterium sp. PL02]